MVRIPRRKPRPSRHPFFKTMIRPRRPHRPPLYRHVRALARAMEIMVREVAAIRYEQRDRAMRAGDVTEAWMQRDHIDELDDELSGR